MEGRSFSDECGTKFKDTTDELPDAPEHYKPWRLMFENYGILKTIEPEI